MGFDPRTIRDIVVSTDLYGKDHGKYPELAAQLYVELTDSEQARTPQGIVNSIVKVFAETPKRTDIDPDKVVPMAKKIYQLIITNR